MTGVLCLGFPVKAYGAEIEKAENTIALSESAEPFAAGLITYYSLSCSGSLKAIYKFEDFSVGKNGRYRI